MSARINPKDRLPQENKSVTVIRISESGSEEEFEWKGYWSGQGWYTYDGFRIRVVAWIDDSDEVSDVEVPVALKFPGGTFTTEVKCASDASNDTKFHLAYKKLCKKIEYAEFEEAIEG